MTPSINVQILAAMSSVFDHARKALGKPEYEDDHVLLYHGDCFELLGSIPAETIPLTVTSPPYNIGKPYETVREITDYIDWTAEWVQLVHAATVPAGAFWLNVGYMPIPDRAKAMPIPYLIWDRSPFFLVQEVVWNYGAGVAGRLFFSPRNEKFLWYVKDQHNYVFNLDDVRDKDVKYPNQKKNGKLKCNPAEKNPTDVWQIPTVTSGSKRSSKERTAHPAQFPTSLVSRVILASSNKGDVILDPFSGSGSCLEAAVQTRRKAIGIEIDPEYIKLAAGRLRELRRSIHLKPAQASLFEPKAFP